jgi:phosphatidylinositol alpha-1,6-mannosyltransferase
MNNALSILFITRTYPPVKGGMEQLSYDITTEVGKLTNTKVIANRYGKKFLPIFFVTATVKGLFSAKNYDAIHIGDPVLCFIGWTIKN